jgi:hypothetical protein
MRKVLKYGLVFAVVMTFGAGSALAGDQIKNRDRKRDGSCRSSLTESMDLAASKIQKRDRKRDGSCQSSITEPGAGLIFAADRDKDRIKRRAGSC